MVALLVFGAGVIIALDRPTGLTWVTWARVALTLGLAVGTVWRRSHPLTLALIAVGCVALGASELALPAVLGTLSVGRRDRVVTLTAIAGALAYLAARWFDAAPPDRAVAVLLSLPNALLLAGLPVIIGAYLRTRRDLLHELQDRAERAEADRAAREESARSLERTRIAREMHDVLAHRVSLVVLHAGALEMNPDQGAADVQRSATQIRTTAREALDEMRGVLGVLRSGTSEGASLRPQPTLADLGRLVSASAEAGIAVRLESTISEMRNVPPLLGRTAYRIVQEALTNVHKHTVGASATVRLCGAPGTALQVDIVNSPNQSRGPALPVGGAGLGLVGLRERVELTGGSLHAGPARDGGFLVHAELPWPARVAAS